MPLEKLYAAPLSIEELCLVEPLTVGCHAVARGLRHRRGHRRHLRLRRRGPRRRQRRSLSRRNRHRHRPRRRQARDRPQSRRDAPHPFHPRADVHDRLQQITGGHGPDVIIEAIGRPETFRAAVEEVAFTGRVVYIGYAKDLVSYETRLFVQKELDILGSRNALPEDFREVIRMFEQKRFPTADTISTTVPLEDAPAILRAWSENPAAYTKIMIDLD